MTQNEGGPTTDRGGDPEPTQDNRGRDQSGITGNAAVKGEKPSPGGHDESSSADRPAAIDLDTAHDRAS